MLVGWTEEQVHLGRATRALLGRTATEREVRRLMATPNGFEPDTWSALVGLGLVSILIPEQSGGMGGSLTDLGVVLEEMGRRLIPGPYLSTAVLAVQALLAVDPPAQAEPYLKQIASGAAIATVAVTEGPGRWAEADVATSASRDHDGWRLSGTKTFVPDGASADLLLVVARAGDGLGLFAVSGEAPGVTRASRPTMDQTRKQATVELNGAHAQRLPTTGPVWDVVADVVRVGMVAVAAEQVGGALEVLDLVLDHVTRRRQFGKLIGSFQAIQHKCADLMVDIEAARSAAYYAERAIAEQAPDAPAAAELAKSHCSDMYRRVTDAAVQMFGGIGMTWEHPIHLYLKRARSSEILFGTPAQHRERLATLIGL
jgi:alkylation response protein AidB-like acyl-CoA dehydrogenase